MKYTPEGGCIGFAASVEADKVKIMVSDNGCRKLCTLTSPG